MDLLFFLPEAVEKQLAITAGSIKSPFNRLRVRIIVFHVVRKHHQLCDIHKTAKYFHGKACIDTGMLRNDPIPVVGLFHFDKGKG